MTEAEESDEAKGSTEAAEPAAEAATEDEPAEPDGRGRRAAADDVEIPKQQTAEQAADNEAGEGARK